MHAYLFIGDSEQTNTSIGVALEKEHVASYDRVTLIPADKASVGIKEARQFIHDLSLMPQSSTILAGIIPDGSLLTPEAQQALLKTIEEPPPHVQLYIGVVSESQLLETIVSRCQLIHLTHDTAYISDDDVASCMTTIESLTQATLGERLKIIQSIGKTRDDAKRWIEYAIMCYRKRVKMNDKNLTLRSQDIAILHELLSAKQLASNNVHPVQLLEHIYLATTI
jgi:DNA polymerase III gamma/tau subunit